ncbi:hypothetical protein [Paraburkholderia agricolaris]|uniref:hypothetical protein n=1 Tax=Paraburkholderia agricolaris TaxID=2152888 RepID=UPI001291770E|nr:hypothetical protein [Paraburkholderia agricolaris]
MNLVFRRLGNGELDGPGWEAKPTLTFSNRMSRLGRSESIIIGLSPTMKRHSPAPSPGHSGVGSTKETAIQFAMLNVASSAFADIGEGRVACQQRTGLLTVTTPHNGMAAFCISELTLPTRSCRSI